MRYYWLGSLLAFLTSACSTPSAEQHQASSPVHIRWARDPETLDPQTLSNQNAVDASNLLQLALLQNDFATGGYGPALVEALPRVQLLGDSLTLLDYHLRPQAAWDSGQPVLATDVDFTLKLMQCPNLPNEGARVQFSFIRQVRLDPTDARHFTFVCRGQATEFIVSSGDYPIISEAALDPGHTLRKLSLATLQDWPATRAPAPAVAALVRRYQQADPARHPEHLPGCGPYRLAAWDTDRQLIFQRKAHWWADALPAAPAVLQARPQQLIFTILPDDATAALALRRHEVDVYPQVPARIFRQLQASPTARQAFAFYTKSSYDLVTAGFNVRQPALRHKLTRQALSRLFDPAQLMVATQLGQGSRTVGLLPPGSPFYNDSLPLPTYAPTQAAALLRQAGWRRLADGAWHHPAVAAPLALVLRYRTDELTFTAVALQFQAAAAQLGIPVQLLPTEGSLLTSCLQSGDFDVYVRLIKGSSSGYNFAPILHTDAINHGNFTGFGRPDTDRLLEHIATEGNPRRKRLLLRRFQGLLQDEMPILPLFFVPYRLAVSRQLHHVIASSLKPGYAATALSWQAADSLATRAH